jgi:2-amino-4-hydroxy-6-hydroxymethyldihydropteridine diphosphokinase
MACRRGRRVIAWIGLGANLGDVRDTLRSACAELDRGPLRLLAASGLWATKPMGPPGQPDYLNAVVRLASALGPRALLGRLKEIERGLGRQARPRWRERELDLDLLLAVEDGVVQARAADLALPHPGLRERVFVLAPLLQLDEVVAERWAGGGLAESLRRLVGQDPASARQMEDAGWCRNS